MIKVYTANDPLNAHVIAEILENEGINAVVQDERLFEVRGEIPVVYPSVWVSDDTSDAARGVVERYIESIRHPAPGTPWICPKCGEKIEPQFTECWNCNGGSRESFEDTSESGPAESRVSSRARKILVAIALVICGVLVFLIWSANKNQEARQRYSNGLVLSKQHEYDRAIAQFDKAIEFDVNFANAYIGRGLAYKNKGLLDKAIADYTRAIQLDSRAANAYIDRCGAYWHIGDFDRAMTDANMALQLNPHSSAAYTDRGLVKMAREQYAQATADFTRSIQIDSASSIAYLDRAVAYYHQKDFHNALADIARAAQLDPQSVAAFQFRGKLNSLAGHREKAKADFIHATQLVPRQTSERTSHAYALAAIGNFENALEECVQTRDSSPKDRGPEYGLACIYCMRAASHVADAAGRKAREADLTLAEQALKRAFEKGMARGIANDDPDLAILKDWRKR